MQKSTNRVSNVITQNKLLTILIIALLSYAIIDFIQQGVFYSLLTNDIATVQSSINDWGIFSGVAYVLLIVIEVIAAPIPSVILYSIGGILFGGFWATALTFVGNIIGSGLAYYISQTYFRTYFTKKISHNKLQQFEQFIKKHGSKSIFLLRINPITSSDIVSYLAGLTNMKFTPFIISTGLGLLPLILIQTYFGSEILVNNPLFLFIFGVLTIIYIIIMVWLIYATFAEKKNLNK